MLEYVLNNKEMLVRIFFEHLNIVGTTMLIGIVISLILTYLIVNAPILYEPFMTFFRIVYTIPSLAFFAILIPFTGIGNKTAIIVLTSYTLFYLVNNFLLGIRNIDRDVLDSANAVGYTKLQTYIHVLLPLALPSIMTGIRLATISTIGITTIAYSIGAGGIGRLLFEGMRQLSYNKIFAGSLLVILQNIILNMILLWIEKYTTKLLHLP